MTWEILGQAFAMLVFALIATIALSIVLPLIGDRFFPLRPPQPAKAFRSGDKQAIIIPAEIAYEQPDIMLEIERVGDELRIRPRQPAPQKT